MVTLILGDDKIRVDTIDIGTVSLNYSLKDIKNYGKRNISYSKPITVLKTQQTEKVFKSLFNINTVNGYTISNMVDGELQENSITILKGPIQVVKIRSDSYDIIITSAEFNLFNETGDNLIVGNIDASNDITFDASYYFHTYNRDFVRTQLNSDPSNNGKGYMYPIIDYNNTIDDPEDISNDYDLLPAIACRELFDAIFTKYGYTYELSDDISTYLNKLYIPFNDNVNKYTTNWEYARYRIGNTDTFFPIMTPDDYFEIKKTNTGGDSGITTITGILQGIEVYTGDYDYIYDLEPIDGSTGYGYNIPKNGIYNLTINLLFGVASHLGGGGLSTADMEANLYIVRDNIIFSMYNIGTALDDDITHSYDQYFITNTFNDLDLLRNDKIFVGAIALDIEYTEYQNRMAVLWDVSTSLLLTKQNSFLGNNNSFDLNDLRPQNYKQTDFLNDIFNLFNVYIDVDKNDNNHINIKSYNNYYSNSSTKDWTSKLEQDNIIFESIKNQFDKQIIFQYFPDDDIYNQDYDSKSIYTFNYNSIDNDSEFSNSIKDIKLNTSSTILKTVKST